eukprot:Phypoly_transcript_06653.p1 GENE.Phypoly_transcript_06653~~Phypoly_transcript_06653.p1  ORF type:complete len:531 (+),score=55.01 Phypoly_transcript_06653:139-1731(+)
MDIARLLGVLASRSPHRHKWFQNLEHVVVVVALFYACRHVHKRGIQKTVFGMLMLLVRRVPVLNDQVTKALDAEVDKSVSLFFKKKIDVPDLHHIPINGESQDTIMQWLNTLQAVDADAHTGRLFAYAYPTKPEHEEIIKQAHNLFMQHNALNPIAFPALRKFEVEVVRMTAAMLHGDKDVRGTMTSGGSESLLLAVKTYRDRALELYGITEPEMILCVTAHAVFEKAAKYFGVKTVRVGFIKDTYEMDVQEVERSITKNTVLIVASAPQFPHGIVDPVVDLGVVALRHNIPLHVDACIGGFMLPWVRKLGYPVPDFDFAVPGVTSITADVHKYGYSVKGASVILYKNDSYRKYQFFAYAGWNGGLYISATMQGTRGGGAMAAAWTAMISLGEKGYTEYARGIMETAEYIKSSVVKISDLFILGNPVMTILSFSSRTLNIFSICDVMEEQFHWNLERQQYPDCVHLTLTPAHSNTREQFIADLTQSAEIVRTNPDLVKKGTAAMYGMMAKIPDGAVVDEFLLSLMAKAYA